MKMMKAYCRNCEAVTYHRFSEPEKIQEIVCNACHSIAVSFHSPVKIDDGRHIHEAGEPDNKDRCRKCGNDIRSTIHHIAVDDVKAIMSHTTV